jgi:hypothetical protein
MKSIRKYEPIKEKRNWYYVDYRPPVSDFKFATLNLVIINCDEKVNIVNAMEKELEIWINKYPVPLYVNAFDNSDNLIDFHDIKPENHLIGFFDKDNKLILNWKLLKNEEIPDIALNRDYVDNLYSGLVYKTYEELDTERINNRKKIKFGWVIFIIWLVVIPIVIAILDFSSYWVSLAAFIYSLYKAVRKGLELTNKWPISKTDKERVLKEQLKEHYYYHCQMNPEGFNRIILENLNKIARVNIDKEFKSLK